MDLRFRLGLRGDPADRGAHHHADHGADSGADARADYAAGDGNARTDADAVRPAHRAGAFGYPAAEYAAYWSWHTVHSGLYINDDTRTRDIERVDQALTGNGRHRA